MKQYNKYLLKQLVGHEILSTRNLERTETVTDWSIIDTSDGWKKVLVEDVTDEDFELLLKLKELEYLKSIKSMIKFFVALTIISLVCGLVVLLSLPQ